VELQAQEGCLIAAAELDRVLVATAVPVERDAVAGAFPGGTGIEVIAVGVGPALAAACTASALTAAALRGEPYGLVVSAGIGGGFQPEAAVGSLVVAAEIVGARTGAVLTVSTVTGTAARAAALRDRHPTALAEAMEGFGVAEAAAAHGVPVLEIRAISNPVGPRDRAAWRIPDALAALTEGFGKLTPVLESWNRHDS
jgi:futalosine hydrolase